MAKIFSGNSQIRGPKKRCPDPVFLEKFIVASNMRNQSQEISNLIDRINENTHRIKTSKVHKLNVVAYIALSFLEAWLDDVHKLWL